MNSPQALVPLMAKDKVLLSPCPPKAFAARSPSASMSSAPLTYCRYFCPHSFSRRLPPFRSNSRTPNSRSSLVMVAERVDWEI